MENPKVEAFNKLSIEDIKEFIEQRTFLLLKIQNSSEINETLRQDIETTRQQIILLRQRKIQLELELAKTRTNEELGRMNLQDLDYLRANRHLYPNEFEIAKGILAKHVKEQNGKKKIEISVVES